MLHLIGQAIFGLLVGAIAKFVLPGKDPGGLIMTALIGLAGSLVGTFIGRFLTGRPDYSAHWLMSILGAIVLLLLYRVLVRKRA